MLVAHDMHMAFAMLWCAFVSTVVGYDTDAVSRGCASGSDVTPALEYASNSVSAINIPTMQCCHANLTDA